MIGDGVDTEYWFYLCAWIAAPALLFVIHTRRGSMGGFLVYSYFIGTIMSYWFGAVAYASPWAEFADAPDTIVGFRITSWGLLAFSLGALVVHRSPDQVRQMESFHLRRLSERMQREDISRMALQLFLPIGAGSWVCAFTPLANVAGFGAVLSAGKSCLVLALCLLCWNAWFQSDKRRFVMWLAIGACLPVVTVISSGFIGYGIVMFTSILAFIAMFFRPRWILLVALVGMLFGGVSFWVSYAQYRSDIRASVWGGQDLSSRFDAFTNMLSHLTTFDIADRDHLQMVALRMNQSALVGAAVRNTPDLVPYEDGATIFEALAAVVPRAIWPDKPQVGGSGTYVAKHTLIGFANGTSVGMGQALEFYINFGVPGVIVGFFAFGFLLRWMDIKLVSSLLNHQWDKLLLWFLVGSALLNPGGSLAEIAALAMASAMVAYGGAMFRRRVLHQQTMRPASA